MRRDMKMHWAVAVAVVVVAVLATDDDGCDVIAQRVWRSGLR